MANHVRHQFQKLIIYLFMITLLTIGTLYVFRHFIAAPISLPTLIEQAVRVIIIVVFWAAAIVIIRRFKPIVAERIGNEASTIIQYIMVAIAVLVMIFGILDTLEVSASQLLTSAGIITITVGLIISTFVGSVLSGFLVFTNYPFRVGDNIMFNNIPGRIIAMTPLVMKIQTDVGLVTIPNNAIASGGVIITAVHKYPALAEGRLHYAVGDRVITSFKNEEGTVQSITPWNTTVQLDSGKQVTFLNNAVLTGAVPIAKIVAKPTQTRETSEQC